MNLTSLTSPAKFPELYRDYPKNNRGPDGLPTKPIPYFFRFDWFYEDLSVAYLTGIGIDHQQLDNLIFDYITLLLVSVYMTSFGNPIYGLTMKKVFW